MTVLYIYSNHFKYYSETGLELTFVEHKSCIVFSGG